MDQNRIGKFNIVERIGRGGIANVFKALHPELDRVVALKVLNRSWVHSPEMRERFRREARAIAALRHANIVQVFDFDVADDVYFMVMEYIEGETLIERLDALQRKGQAMPLPELLRVVIDVGRALHYAHQQDMLHRDIKPGNIMYRGDGSIVLTDFGMAKILNAASDLTGSGAVAGTPAYMAPEQWTTDEPDKRSDIYSLGVVLYQMATGKLPFTDSAVGRLMYKHISEEPPLPSQVCCDIPKTLERVILRALAKHPEDRYQTALEMVRDLESTLYQVESTAPTGVFARSLLPTPILTESGNSKAFHKSALHRYPYLWLGVGVVLVFSILAVLAVRGPIGSAEVADTPDTSDATGTALAARLVVLESTLSASVTPAQRSLSTATLLVNAATPTTAPTATPNPTPTPLIADLRSPTGTPTQAPIGPTLPSSTAVCRPSALLQEDVNYSSFLWWSVVGAQFQKSWQLVNDGDCSWPQDTVLVHLDGIDFGLVKPHTVGAVSPGETLELSIALVAPRESGEHEGRFQLQSSAGGSFGAPLTVKVEVRDQAASTTKPLNDGKPVKIAGYVLIDWTKVPDEPYWRGTVALWAEGGTGEYKWYRDTLDNPLPGDVLDFEWGVCLAFSGSVWVKSGESIDHEGLYIPYPETCP